MSSMKNRTVTPATSALLPDAGFDVERLHAPCQALAAFFARAELAACGGEHISLDETPGRILREAIVCDADVPAAARSSMDGFAIAAAGAPGRFRIVGEIRMGHAPPTALASGQAMRIPTGGVLPEGADAVVPVEDVRVEGGVLIVDGAVALGDCVNPRGDDVRAGELLLEPGRRLGAPEIGLLATLGVTEVPVYRRPRIAVLSSGDELVRPDRTPALGQIRDSNRYAVAASLRAMGAQPVHLPTVPDDPVLLQAELRAAHAAHDGVVLTGGSSVGERDHTPAAIAALGRPGVLVHGLRVKPGKPTVLAAVDGKPVIGLPGNPASALLILEAVVAPIVAHLVGARAYPASTTATLAAPVVKRPGWTWYVPMLLKEEDGEAMAHPLPIRSSHVSLLARAAGYSTFGEEESEAAVGTKVVVTHFLVGGAHRT